MCAKRKSEKTLFIEVKVAIFKYGSPLHFFKSRVRTEEKGSPHLCTCLSSLGWAGRMMLGRCMKSPSASLSPAKPSSPENKRYLHGKDIILLRG